MDNSEKNVIVFTEFNFRFINYSTQFRFISVVTKQFKITFVFNAFFSSILTLWYGLNTKMYRKRNIIHQGDLESGVLSGEAEAKRRSR
jgi:hypothetical protein